MDPRGPPITTEILKRYNAAGLDLYTVELAQRLCERFSLSKEGYRNLSDTFASLPDIQIFEQNFEVGYGLHHPVPVILKTNSGSILAAIVGSLSEYFIETIVVDFFILLTRRANVPRVSRPRPEQWRRLVEVFYGILVPSKFGFLLGTIESACPRLVAEPDPERILKALEKMSERAILQGQQERALVIEADSEVVYLAAVSVWLFGLNTTVSTISNEVVYRSSTESAANIEFQLMPQKNLMGQSDGMPLSPMSPIPSTKQMTRTVSITGGRVSFDRLFQSSFGMAFTSMSKDSLSAVICCSSQIIQHHYGNNAQKLQGIFLSQQAAKSAKEKHSLKETILAWYPEIHRLSSKIEKFDHLSEIESKSQLEKALTDLRSSCQCSACKGGTVSHIACQVAIAMLVVKLGLSVSRIVLSPRVNPKKLGILSLYEQCFLEHTSWKDCGTSISASEYFTYHTLGMLPPASDLLQTACKLFTTSNPGKDLPTGTKVMGVTHRGFAIFLTMFVDIKNELGGHPNVQSIRVMPGWMCPFGQEMKLEVYDPAYTDMTFAESWEVVSSKPKDIHQILRQDGDIVRSSIVFRGSHMEEQAKLDGWFVVDDQLD